MCVTLVANFTSVSFCCHRDEKNDPTHKWKHQMTKVPFGQAICTTERKFLTKYTAVRTVCEQAPHSVSVGLEEPPQGVLVRMLPAGEP